MLNCIPSIYFSTPRFAKPIDTKLIDTLLDNHEYLITIEEGAIGGFGSMVLDYVNNIRLKKNITKIYNIHFPDKFVEHALPGEQYKSIGMDSDGIEKKILELFDINSLNEIVSKTSISE